MVIGAVVVAPNVVMGSVEAMAVVGGAVVVMSAWRERRIKDSVKDKRDFLFSCQISCAAIKKDQ